VANLAGKPALIAVPGVSKASDTEADLDLIWECASDALATADHASLVGCSCPQSDEKAKAMLLDSLHKNPKKPPLDIVLSPGSPIEARRLASLLSSADLGVRDAGMWAQDYLALHGVGQGWETLDRRS